MQRRNATIRGPRHFLRSGPLKLITKNSRTVGGPYHQWGPPSLDAAATPSLRHCNYDVNGHCKGAKDSKKTCWSNALRKILRLVISAYDDVIIAL